MIRRPLALLLLLSALALPASARGLLWGWAEQGGSEALTSLTGSRIRVQRSCPGATVEVFTDEALTVPATVYSDLAGTALIPPITADPRGYWRLYADDGDYWVRISGPCSSGGSITTYALGPMRISARGTSLELAVDGFQGCRGGDLVDDTSCIQTLLNYITAGLTPAGFVPSTYTRYALSFGGGTYRISAPLILPTGISVTLKGPEAPPWYPRAQLQWVGADTPSGYMLDARSVLGLSIRYLGFVGQSDLTNAASASIGNGLLVGRTSSGLFGSVNEWTNVLIYRFPGVGLTLGKYTGYSGGVYPADTGQVDNSQFTNLNVLDCRTGIVINSPNFLQTQFTHLWVANYGGNPVDGSGTPIESVSAAPVKYRTKNAVRVLYGSFEGEGIHVYASYADADPESQYAIYVLDGEVKINSGYSESRYLLYVANGANGTGGISTWGTNTIANFRLFSGAAGGPVTAGKYPIYYSQSVVPLVLKATYDIWVLEAAGSAGVYSFGARSQQPAISLMDTTTFARNMKSSDFAAQNMTFTGGVAYFNQNNNIGASASIFSRNTGEMFFATNLRASMSSAPAQTYQFFTRDGSGSGVMRGLLVDTSGLSFIVTGSIANASSFDLATLKGSTRFRVLDSGLVEFEPITFANLGTPTDGTFAFCSNCTKATPCASGGTGALAKRLNGAWDCN